MDENAGLLKGLEVLGSKVADLESDLKFERLRNRQLQDDVQRLNAEKGKLETKLDEVKEYFKLGQE